MTGFQSSTILTHLKNHFFVGLVSRSIPVLSVFLYTHLMSVSDYGTLSLYLSYVSLAGVVLSLNFHTAFGRYIYTPNAEFSGFLSTTLISLAIIYLCCTVAIIVNINTVSTYLQLPKKVIYILIITTIGFITESIFSQYAIYKQYSSLLLKVTSSKAILLLILSLTLLFFFESEKYYAALSADLVVNTSLSFFVLFFFRKHIKIFFSKKHLRYIFLYSFPLLPYMFSLSVLSQFDRILITKFFSTEETGLYSLAYNAGFIQALIITALLNAFNPSYYNSLNQKDYIGVSSYTNSIVSIAVVFTAGMVIFGSDVVGLIVPEKYLNSLNIIPIVAIGGLCNAYFQIYVRIMAYVNKTYLISIISLISMLINIVLNYLLLPLYGYKMAAVVTLISYMVMSVLCIHVSNKYIKLFYVKIWDKLLYVLLLLLVYLFFEFFKFSLLTTLIFKSFIFVSFLFFFWKNIKVLLPLK